MKDKQPVYVYDMYLVRTKGIKSILYRVIHNSYWDSVAFISKHGSVISINRNGVFLTTLPEYKKESDVIAMKKSKTFYIEESTAFNRFMGLLQKRRSIFYDYRNIVQRFINNIGKFLGIKRIQNLEIRNERKICYVEFIINMFDVSNEISYNDKSIDWFEDNDIYDFLNLPKINGV